MTNIYWLPSCLCRLSNWSDWQHTCFSLPRPPWEVFFNFRGGHIPRLGNLMNDFKFKTFLPSFLTCRHQRSVAPTMAMAMLPSSVPSTAKVCGFWLILWSQVCSGRPRVRFQVGSGGWPFCTLMARSRARFAETLWPKRATWPKRAERQRVMMDVMLPGLVSTRVTRLFNFSQSRTI